jgi:hypothetical protein
VNVHAVPGNVFENPIVGCRPAPSIMLRLQAVNGNCNVQPWIVRPAQWNFTKCAGDKLRMDAANRELRKDRLQFAIPHQGITSHNGEMQGAKLIHQGQNPQNQVTTFVIRELSQV